MRALDQRLALAAAAARRRALGSRRMRPSRRDTSEKARAAFRRPSIPVASVGFGRGASCLAARPEARRPAARNARPLRSAMAIPQWVSGTRLYPLVPPLPVLLESVTSGPPPFRGKPECIPSLVDDGKPRSGLRTLRFGSGVDDDHAVVAHAHRDTTRPRCRPAGSAPGRSGCRSGLRGAGRQPPARHSRTRPRTAARRRGSTDPRSRTAHRRSCRPRS